MEVYPDLCDVLDVEEFISEYSGDLTIETLWEAVLPDVPREEFEAIMDYLFETHKIAVDNEGTLGWIGNTNLVKNYLSNPDLFWDGGNDKTTSKNSIF